jgi:hypothetical protein
VVFNHFIAISGEMDMSFVTNEVFFGCLAAFLAARFLPAISIPFEGSHA